MPLSARDYKEALDVQSASNLSGVVLAFGRATCRIWEEARECGEGTAWVNTHSIAVMYSSKIASLTGSEMPEQFHTAYLACEQKSKEHT